MKNKSKYDEYKSDVMINKATNNANLRAECVVVVFIFTITHMFSWQNVYIGKCYEHLVD